MNKSGAIAEGFLLLIIFVMMMTAGVVFVSSDRSFNQIGMNYAIMMSGADFYEDMIIKIASESANRTLKENSCNCDSMIEVFKKTTLKREMGLIQEGNFFKKVNSGDFQFENVSGNWTFVMDEVYIYNGNGDNKIKRNFNISIFLGNITGG